jgi:CRISPR-associated protein Cas2
MKKQFVLVVYDIYNDRRRNKLHNVLLDYGTPVQYSVFECLLDKKALTNMKKAIKHIIRPRVDNLRLYYLCAECLEKTETTAGVEVHKKDPEVLVV